mgnify:FL=1
MRGWPNRYKTEQYGYYPLDKTKKVCIDKKYIVAVFAYSLIFLKTLNSLAREISDGKIDEIKVKWYTRKLEKILSNKKIQLVKPVISLKAISSSMVYGMIRNLVLREIRQSYLSIMKLKGWSIINCGDHPVKLKNKKEIDCTVKNIGKIIKEKFVSKDIRKEYYKLLNIQD